VQHSLWSQGLLPRAAVNLSARSSPRQVSQISPSFLNTLLRPVRIASPKSELEIDKREAVAGSEYFGDEQKNRCA